MSVLSVALIITGVYLALGVAFSIPFVIKGAGAIDDNARGGSWGFRIMILPGSAALWPVLLMRWRRAGATS